MNITAVPADPSLSSANAPLVQQQVFDAAERGDSHAIRLLALRGADLQARNEDGFTAFAVATRNNQADTAMTILAAIEAQFLRSLSDESPLEDADPALKKTA